MRDDGCRPGPWGIVFVVSVGLSLAMISGALTRIADALERAHPAPVETDK